MPAVAGPFVLGGAALGSVTPERDDLVVDGHRLRIETWPNVRAGTSAPFPLPESLGKSDLVGSVTIISYLANSAKVADGMTVAYLHLTGPSDTAVVPIRAGIEVSEWAWDRPDVRGTVAHRRAEVAGHWVGQPRGNLYVTRLAIDPPQALTAWHANGADALGADGAWEVRAATFAVVGATGDGQWRDARTGDRIWSERQSRDFWAQIGFGMVNVVVTAASVLMVWRIGAHLGYRDSVRLVTTAGYAFGTIAWPYAKYDFSEPLAALAILVAVDVVYRTVPRRDHRELRGHITVARGLAVAVACLVAVAAKYSAGFAIAFVALEWCIVARPWATSSAVRRPALRFGVSVVASVVLIGAVAGALLLRTTGEVPILLTSGLDRLRDDWFTLPLWTGLRGLLFSPGKGLFVYAPWLLLAPIGMAIRLWRAQHGATGLAMLVAYPSLSVLAYAQKLVWHGGAWGPRYLVLVVPWLALACAPVIEWALAGRARRALVAALAAVSIAVQCLAIAKHPEQFAAMARRHVLASLPRFGADFGGRDYWDARGGDLLVRALRDEASGTPRKYNLGYLWGYPDAWAIIHFREPRDVQIGIYAVDWDRRARTQSLAIDDASGTRTLAVGPEMATGVWVVTTVHGNPRTPVTIRLRQTGPDTAVLSAITFDPPAGTLTAGADPRGWRLDPSTAGDWPGRYGSDGRIFPAFRSFNIDDVQLPAYIDRYEFGNKGDRPNPTIHVEIAEDDLLDTAILYATPFSPVLGNAWLVAADILHLIVPARPDLADGILIRPPWRWFGVLAPRLEHPEYGLGLDFWPTIIWSNYRSHPRVIALSAITLVTVEGVAIASLWRLFANDAVMGTAKTGVRNRSVVALVVVFAAYNALMVLP
jgi:hypothetical protein